MPGVQFVRPGSVCEARVYVYAKFQMFPKGYSLKLCSGNDGVKRLSSLPSFCILWSPDQRTGSFHAEHLEPSSREQGLC